MRAKKNAVRTAALAACVIGLTATAGAQQVAWAYVTPAGSGASWTPGAGYRYTSSGASITVTRITNNRFSVLMPGVASTTGGCVLATAYSGNHTVVVNNWAVIAGDVTAFVETFDASGGPANDAPFTICWRHEGPADRREAYLWADQPATASYTPNTTFSWNGSRADPTITRSGPGVYTVTLPGLQPTGAEGGHVQVTPYGSSLLRTKVVGWNHPAGCVINVACFDAAGTPTDGRFVLSYNEVAAPIATAAGSGAHVWASSPASAFYSPNSLFTDSNGREGPRNSETIQRTGTGTYAVDLPNVVPSSSSIALATAHGPGSGYASVGPWSGNGSGGTRVIVRTFTAAGASQDSAFTLLYLTNHPAVTADVAWSWVIPLGHGATFTPAPQVSYTTSGGTITVDRDPVQSNRFLVHIPGIAPEVGGVVHASALSGNHTAVVSSWSRSATGEITAAIALFTPTGAAANDREFTVLFRINGTSDAREAYLWADQPSAASYTPDTTYSWNGNRADPTITRTAVGSYAVTLPGLAAAGPERGHVQVTAYSSSALRAKVVAWSNSGANQVVTVRCYDSAGALVDGRFVLSYNEVAAPIPADRGSGGHLWADQPTAASYTPSAPYADSNVTLGPANETISRISTGYYQVHLPHHSVLGSKTAQVTAYGAGSQYATILNWMRDSAGMWFFVWTRDAAGAPADAPFTLLYLTNLPAAHAAFNTPIGSGCNGPVLTPNTRPILGTNWDLALSGIPAGATIGLTMVGFSNPALPIGPSAPGCTLYVGNPVLNVLLLPAPNPAYRLFIPLNPIFIGTEVFAQGGAIVPSINPLWVAASNGVRGTVGDF